MVLPSLDRAGQIVGEVVLNTYREFYDFVEANKDEALPQFQIFYGESERS